MPDSTMTLEQIRDWHRTQSVVCFVGESDHAAGEMHDRMAKSIDVHLAGNAGARVACNAIPVHDWEELSCVQSEYEPSLETGWRECKLCGTKQTFTREIKPS